MLGISPSVQVATASAIVGKKKCPACAEFVQPEANVCRFCQHSFVEELELQRVQDANFLADPARPWIEKYSAVVFLGGAALALGAILGYSFVHNQRPILAQPEPVITGCLSGGADCLVTPQPAPVPHKRHRPTVKPVEDAPAPEVPTSAVPAPEVPTSAVPTAQLPLCSYVKPSSGANYPTCRLQ